jgi:hypothetical protein
MREKQMVREPSAAAQLFLSPIQSTCNKCQFAHTQFRNGVVAVVPLEAYSPEGLGEAEAGCVGRPRARWPPVC